MPKKRHRPAQTRPLSDREVRKLGAGEHAVGGAPGLILRVRASGHRSFSVRYRTAAGEQRNLNLGRYPDEITLGQARTKANALRPKIREGSDPVAERRAAIRSARVAPTKLADAITKWMDEAKDRLRPKTLNTYGIAVSNLLAWADGKVVACADLDRAHLAELRTYLIAKPKQVGARGSKRGRKRKTKTKRSPIAVNRELRTLKTILNSLRRAGQLPQLDRDAITDNLAALPVPQEQPTFLRTKQIGELLAACTKHDAAVFAMTRDEKLAGAAGTTARYPEIRPFALFLLLTGCRRGEALGLRWEQVDLDAKDNAGTVVGEIRLRAGATKTHRARTIHLDVSPMLRSMLVDMRRKAKDERVFEDLTAGMTDKARQRLLTDYGAPRFTWKDLRSTCGTYLTNAPGIFGAATVYLSARQLGHSVAVAEKHYLGVIRGIPANAHSLEAAMQFEATSSLKKGR